MRTSEDVEADYDGLKAACEQAVQESLDGGAGGARLRWIEERRLLAAGLEPWRDVPLWLAPGTDPSHRGFLAMSNARAKAAGLELRPLVETIRDTLDWARRTPAPADPPAGLDPRVDRRLLAAG